MTRACQRVEAGIDRVVAGFETLAGPTELAAMVRTFGSHIVFSLDLHRGEPLGDSWELGTPGTPRKSLPKRCRSAFADCWCSIWRTWELAAARVRRIYVHICVPCIPRWKSAPAAACVIAATWKHCENVERERRWWRLALHDGRLEPEDCRAMNVEPKANHRYIQ